MWVRVLAVVLVAAAALVGCAATPSATSAPEPAPSSAPARPVTASGALSGVSASGGVAVVLAEEAAAVGVTVGQPVRVSFAAVPGLELGGRVVAVAPNAVTVSGVTSYYITVQLTGGDPRLRTAMTAEVTLR